MSVSRTKVIIKMTTIYYNIDKKISPKSAEITKNG